MSELSPSSSIDADRLRQDCADHLWGHFTPLPASKEQGPRILTRGDGCYLEDLDGRRLLDGLAGLFTVQIGYSFGEEMGEAAARQLAELPFATNWSYAHPRSIELATELAALAPEGMNRVFFTSGGAESVEAAWKVARQYHSARGERRWKAISRHVAYHGTSMGALSITGVPGLREPFEPLVPQVAHVRNTTRFRRPADESEAEFTQHLLDDLEQTIEAEGPGTIAMVIMEPVQNSGGALTPPEGYFAGVRELCDHHGILLCADEVITGFGRTGAWFASEKYDIRPDLITCAKGMSSAYASIGAMIASDKVTEAFGHDRMFMHGVTFGGHPLQAALALKNIEIMKREGLVEHVAEREDAFRRTLEPLTDLPIVGDLRGTGFFLALELVKDKGTMESFTPAECDWLLRDFLSERLYDCGLICRADDRGEPVVQLSPPLVADQPEFDEAARILREVLGEAADRLSHGSGVTPGTERPESGATPVLAGAPTTSPTE